MKTRQFFTSLFAACLLLLLAVLPVEAQTAVEYRLNVSKSFGYNNGSQIRGTFTLSISAPQDAVIRTVTFLVDGQPLGVVSAEPFTLKFQTGDFPSGWHDLSAVVETSTGSTAVTPVRRFNFLNAEQEAAGMRAIFTPTFGLLGILLLVMLITQVLVARNRKPLSLEPGAARNYGYKGGSICPRCHRPFGLHWWSVNLLMGVYDRCDFCGKWSFLRRLSYSQLQAAEAAEKQMFQSPAPETTKSEEEKLRELLDESKYVE